MAPKPDVSEERKAQIYQAVLACFDRKGYHLTTMDDIVAESGLSKGALYWYFKSKKELFLSLFKEIMGPLGQSWEAIAANPETSSTDKLRASMSLFRAGLGEMVSFFGILMEAWSLTRHDEDVEGLIQEFYEPYLNMMARLIEEGVASGELDVSSVRAMAMVIISLYDSIALALGMGLWQHDWNEIMDATEELVWRGLGLGK